MKKVSYAFPKQIEVEEFANIRKKLGLSQKKFAELLNISASTVARWEQGTDPITGPTVVLLKILMEDSNLIERYELVPKTTRLRLFYMYHDMICTIIDVDDREQKVYIKNYTKYKEYKAFGTNENPTYEDYKYFLESRCFPASRDKIKIELKKLNLPFYDPMMIIEKTEGRMAEDDFYIRIER